jgi:hypothetical protein
MAAQSFEGAVESFEGPVEKWQVAELVVGRWWLVEKW